MVGVGAIIFKGSQVLLVQRGREPAYGKWSVPGGLVEVGESLRDAVRREVREEVGLDVRVGDLATVLDRVIPDENGRPLYHYVLLDFVCEYRGGEPKPASDALQCAFVEIDVLSELSLTTGTREVIVRALSSSRSTPYPVYDPLL
ncbi:MAG: NUDIX hydrolase [Syntrophobacteraceae bacterium]